MNEVYLSKKVLENPELTDEGFLVYVALRMKWCYSKHNFNRDIIHLKDLLWLLSGTLDCTNNYLKKMQQGLDNLVTLGLLEAIPINTNTILASFKSTYFFSAKKDSSDFEPYVIIYVNEIQKIMSSDEKFRDKMLRYFVAKIGTIYHGENKRMTVSSVGYGLMNNVDNMSISHCADLARIGQKAAIDYEKWFEKNNLLVILRSSNKILDEFTLRIVNGFPNCYARPEHIAELKKYYDQREDNVSNTNIIQISKEADTRRSYKQTYNAYKRGLRHDKMLLLRALCERMDNNIKIRNTLIERGDTCEEVFYETEMEIECLSQEISEVSWKGFLDGEIELSDAS